MRINGMYRTRDEAAQTDVLEIVSSNDELGEDPSSFDAWLVRDGVVVGFLDGNRPYAGSDDSGFLLKNIETRQGFRNSGIANSLMEMVKAHFGVNEVWCSGQFTPEGYAFIRPNVSIQPSNKNLKFPIYNPVTFVDDWDSQIKKVH